MNWRETKKLKQALQRVFRSCSRRLAVDRIKPIKCACNAKMFQCWAWQNESFIIKWPKVVHASTHLVTFVTLSRQMCHTVTLQCREWAQNKQTPTFNIKKGDFTEPKTLTLLERLVWVIFQHPISLPSASGSPWLADSAEGEPLVRIVADISA